MIRKILNITLKFLAACLLIILLYLIYVVLINLKDQPESPTAKEFSEAINVLDLDHQENNGYIFMMGLNAPKDKDPFAIGLDRVKWIQEMNDQPLDISGDLPHKFPDLEDYLPETVKLISDSCKDLTKKCINLIKEHRNFLNSWFSENIWMISRYEQLVVYSNWKEPNITNIYSPIADYSSLIFLQRLHGIFVFSTLESENSVDHLRLLDLSISFWRRSLTQNTNILAKMMSAALVRIGFNWTNRIFLELNASDNISKVPASLIDSFTREEQSMRLVYIGEWHFVRNVFDERDFGIHNPAPYRYIMFAYQPQLSRNRHAEILKRMIDISDQDITNFESALMDSKVDHSSTGLSFLDFVYPYNITGEFILKDVRDSDFLSYTAKIKDLEGARRALLLSIKMMMGETFDPIDPQLVNPYTQKPINHKPEKRSFEFIGLSQQGSYNTYEYFY